MDVGFWPFRPLRGVVEGTGRWRWGVLPVLCFGHHLSKEFSLLERLGHVAEPSHHPHHELRLGGVGRSGGLEEVGVHSLNTLGCHGVGTRDTDVLVFTSNSLFFSSEHPLTLLMLRVHLATDIDRTLTLDKETVRADFFERCTSLHG